jgi:microcystin-dependent protein
MSVLRVKSRAINRNVYYDNKLNTFTQPPIQAGNLFVENDERVDGNMDISGNLRIGGELTAKSFYANTGNFYLDNYMLIPYGTIIQSAAVTVPQGWLLCDGASILKTIYLNLYNAIGYTYGGSGNNFNVPDIRGRVAIGTGTGAGLTARTLGNKSGEETHQLSVGEMPSHSHTSNATGGTIGLITSTGANTASTGLDNTSGEPDLFATLPALTINNTGSSNAHNNMQPYIVLNYLIKY